MKNLKRSQILTSNYPYYKYSLNYALDSLHRMGAEQIEFYACFPHFHMDDITYRDIKSLKKKLKDFGLKAMCVTPEQCLYPVNIAAFDIAARNRSINVFKKTIETAAELEADTIVALCGYGTIDEKDEDVWKRSVDSMRILGDMAEAYNIEMVLETSPREYTTTHTAKEAVRMIEEIGSPAVKGMIDTATLGFSKETMKQAVQDLGKYLRHVHVADGIPNGHLILGEGELDIRGMLHELDEVNYQGMLSLEILNDKYMRTPHEAMQISFEMLKKYIDQ